MIGANRIAKAAPDGYQFMIGTVGTHAANQTLYKNPPYNAAIDFAPVALIVDQPSVLISRKNLPANTLREFIDYAKSNQSSMQYGSPGAGSGSHLSCVLFNAAAGIDVPHIPYRVGQQAIQDLIAGRLDYECTIASSVVSFINSNQLKAIAIFSKDRSSVLPNLPSAHEQGLADFEAGSWNAFFFPRGTSETIVRKLHDATIETMNTPSVQTRLKEIGAELVAPNRRSPEYLQKFVESEIKKWAAAIKTSGVSLD